LIGTAAELDDSWLADANVVGVSAGASTPDELVSEVVESLCRDGAAVQEKAFLEERVAFRLPEGVVGNALEGPG
jgi:4-hydroxy-3-methylbut-2-enyl diphosphate reductase